MKKYFLVFLCAIILMIPFSITASAAADTKSELDLNFIIVLDNSGSLSGNDPGKICVDSAKLFIDLLPMTSTRVGVVIFGNGVASTIDLQNVNTQSTRKGLKTKLKKEMDYSEHETDIGAALNKAMSMLEEEGKENSAILFFTDGSLRTFANQMARSRQQVQDAIATANKRGWPIYTVGLNADGSADKEMLNDISLNTDAGDPLIAEKAGQMVEYFTDIFKRYMDIDAPMTEKVINNGYADFTITQPEMASETNIVLTGSGIGNVTLTDPQGNTVNLENINQVYYIREKKYVLLKILQPQPGEWKLHAEGNDGQTIYVQTLNTFDLPLAADVSATSVKKNETVKFDSYLVYNDTRCKMPGFYNQTSAKVVLVDRDTKAKTEHDMQVLEDGYTLSLPMTDGGTFEAQVVVTTPSFKRESDKYTISVENMLVKPIRSIPAVTMKVGTSSTIDLSQYFEDPYGDVLTYSYDCQDQGLALFSDKQNILTITAPGKAGTADVTVTADDKDGPPVSQTFSLTVENAPLNIVKRFSDRIMNIGDTASYNLNDYFNDPEGLPIDYSVSAEGDGCTYTVENGVLTVNAVKTGDTIMSIDAIDSAGEKVSQEAKFTGYSEFDYYFNIILPYFIGSVILILLILAIRYLFTKIRGSMRVWLETEDENGKNTFAEYMFVPTRLKLGKGKVKGKKFNLSDLLNKYRNNLFANYGELNLPSTGTFIQVKFKGVVFGYRAKIRLKPRSAPIILEAGNSEQSLNEQRPPLKIKPGQTMTARITEENKTVRVSVEYIG